ncbi:hypothetical protein HYQ19_gp090 [Arthrobacter phage DrYang]|uniref:Uncharacterized protein n=1 Tax=Arthrobacter phage DrYang TaxID=2686080 RepID=A0A6B9JBV5_9CAUD|nr:hypothetical protein HYQ19_gp090 [Arthrobacter phage DrYang]QGZ17189.1 hypothetical protein SEA_DRYANG_90 [Arthrobacter phage DrYang]
MATEKRPPARKRIHPDSEPAGACINPDCCALVRTNGNVTEETRMMRRRRANGSCEECGKKGYTPERGFDPDKLSDKMLFEGFQWTPELLKDAVQEAMGELFHDAA